MNAEVTGIGSCTALTCSRSAPRRCVCCCAPPCSQHPVSRRPGPGLHRRGRHVPVPLLPAALLHQPGHLPPPSHTHAYHMAVTRSPTGMIINAFAYLIYLWYEGELRSTNTISVQLTNTNVILKSNFIRTIHSHCNLDFFRSGSNSIKLSLIHSLAILPGRFTHYVKF